MANIFETTISCRLCGGVKRITHLTNNIEEKDYGGWLLMKDSSGRTRYVCKDCVDMIKMVVSEK